MTVVACLGDSITEGSPYWDARRQTGDPTGQWQHWAALAHPEIEFRNHGIWGERTDEIAARFDEAARPAEMLIVQGGINDIAQGRSVEDAAERLAGMVLRGLARGLPVGVCDVLPWNNGWPDAGVADPRAERAHRRDRRAAPAVPRHARGSGASRPDEGRVVQRGRRPSVDRRLPAAGRARLPVTVTAAWRFSPHAASARASARA